MDPALEQNRPLAREIVRHLLDAWRLKRAYKYRSEKRVTHRKLYLSLMNQLMHEIGQRSLHDIIMQRINFFNHNFKTSLTLDQFHNLMSQSEKYQEPSSSVNIVKEKSGLELEPDANTNDVEINKDTANDNETRNQSEYEVKSTDALRSLCVYQYDPEIDNEEILSNIKEIEREDGENVDEANVLIGIKTKIEHELVSQDEMREVPENEDSENSIDNTKVRELKLKLQDDEELRRKIEPLLVYKDDPDMYDRIIAPEIRGKKFKISIDGQCPRCHHKRNVFVILDFLFPMGDMPEICNYLIAKGQAVLWSSQDDSHCKDPPTMLCRGKCHTDPSKCGFNLNWNKTDLESIFFFPTEEKPKSPNSLKTEPIEEDGLHSINDSSDSKSLAETGNTSKSKREKTENDEARIEPFDAGHIDMKHYKSNISWVVLDDYVGEGSEDVKMEDELIKTMLALSSAKEDWEKGEVKLWSDDSDEEEVIGCTDQPNKFSLESSPKTTNVQVSSKSYAFSWDSYGSNPWAPVEPTKKKSQSSESKLVMITTGKAHVPTLLNPIEPQRSGEETESGKNEETQSDENIGDSAYKPAVTSPILQAKDSSYAPAKPYEKNEGKTIPEGEESSESKQKPYTADDYPVSKDGACPYCKSSDVVYIIIDCKEENSEGDKEDEDLPDILRKLLSYHLAYKMPKDENEPPSFQCLSCTYGFNLDWSSTDLETIYGQKLEQAEKNVDRDYSADHSAANVEHESNAAYSASDHAHQMPGGAGYPAFYFASPFMGYYPAMGIAAMPYPSFYQPQFMPGYFPSPHGYPSYMAHPSGMPYTTPDGRNFDARGSHWARGRGFVRDRIRGGKQASLNSEKIPTKTKSEDSLNSETSKTQSNLQAVDNQLVADNNGEKEMENIAERKESQLESTMNSAMKTAANLERKPLISDNNTLSITTDKTDTGLRFIEDQPLAPGVDTMEDRVVFAPKEKNEGPNESKPCENQVVGSIDIADPSPPGVITPTSPSVIHSSLSVVHADRSISKESQFLSVDDSSAKELPEVEEENTEEDVETKRSKLEDRGADEEDSTAVEDEETEAAPKRITRSKGRARGRGRGRGRGKRKSTGIKKT